MILINLLPVKAMQRREKAKRQLIFALIIIGSFLTLLTIIQIIADTEMHYDRVSNEQLEKLIAQRKSEVGDYDIIKVQREELLRQRTAIEQLQRARTGPVHVLREISDILTPGKGPTYDSKQYEEMRRRDPNTGIDLSWDPRRAWIISYAEKARAVTMQMGGKSDDDVAQFSKRLKLSAFFSDVYWKQTQPQIDPKLGISYVTFEVSCRVNY